MNVPKELRYTKSHEWIKVDGDTATVGITDFAQEQLSDLTYVELPSVDDEVTADNEIGVVESVKAASDVYAPLSGTVTDINEALEDQPELINSDPFTEGWMFKIKMTNPADADDLLSADQYEELLPDD